MKVFTFPLLTCLLLLSCKKDPDLLFDYCAKGIAEFKKDTVYKGTISFCNAQPPLMSFIPGIATATFIGPDAMQIRLVADSINFDTTFLYLINARLLRRYILKFPFWAKQSMMKDIIRITDLYRFVLDIPTV